METTRTIARRSPLVLLCFFLGVIAGALPSCDRQAADCSNVCNRVRECLSSSFDVEACEKRCRDKAGMDRDYDDRLAHCSACIAGRTCAETVANCTASCFRL